MRLIVCPQFGSSAATEFFKFFCQLARDAEMPLRHDATASLKCLKKPVRRFKKKRRLLAFSCCPQFAFALAAFHGKKSTEGEFLGRKSGTEQSDQNRRGSGDDRKRQLAIDALANEAHPWIRQCGCPGVCDQRDVFASGEAFD